MARLSCGVLSLYFMLLILGGCSTFSPRPQQPTPAHGLTDATTLWQHLEARRRAFRSLKGLARVQVRTGQRRFTVDPAVVVLQGFEAMRLEGIGPFGQPLFLFIVANQHLSLYVPQERTLLSGAATAKNLARLLGIALTPRALRYVLTGDIPLASLPREGKVAYRAEEDLYLWHSVATPQALQYRIWFQPSSWQPVRFEVHTTAGTLLLQVSYDDFRQTAFFALPYRITVVQPLAGRRVRWQYSDVQINTGVAPALFRMQVPAGTRQVDLEQITDPAWWFPSLTDESLEHEVPGTRQG